MNKVIKFFLVSFITIIITIIALSIIDLKTGKKQVETGKKIIGISTAVKIISPILGLTIIPTPSLTLTPSPTSTPSPTLTPVPTITQAPVQTSDKVLEELFVKYSSAYNVDKNLVEKIANCESHFGTGAKNGPYGGMFQFDIPIWTATRQLMGLDPNPDLRYSGEESIKTAAFLLSQNHTSLWPNCSK